MTKLRFLFPIVCVAAIIGGSTGIHTAHQNPNPTDITVDQAAQVEDFTWVRVQGASANLVGAILRTSPSGKLNSAYLPLYASDEPEGAIVALFETDDDEIMALLAEMQPLADDLVALATFYKENRERLVLHREFEGMAQTLGSISGKDRSRLQAAEEDLAENALIIDDGSRPSMTASATTAILGVVGLLFWIRSRRKRKGQPGLVSTPGLASAV